jgi:hypothetical protein
MVLPKTQNEQDNQTRTRPYLPVSFFRFSCYSIAVIVIEYGLQRVG